MQFKIMNVGHGFCAYLITDDNELVVFDCGHSEATEEIPSEELSALGFRAINDLVITNFDEDHISDLPYVVRHLPPDLLTINPTISAAQLETLKLQNGPISPAMDTLLNLMEVTEPVIESENMTNDSYAMEHFYNSYGDFYDTNNISLVTFLDCADTTFFIPGDVERMGWESLLNNHHFRQRLESIDVFIASHHGRENGYCEELFRYCVPEVIIFSDSAIRYATQEMANTYAQHASGITFNGENRYVLTTRRDGSLLWEF